jgi:hypothetical protein
MFHASIPLPKFPENHFTTTVFGWALFICYHLLLAVYVPALLWAVTNSGAQMLMLKVKSRMDVEWGRQIFTIATNIWVVASVYIKNNKAINGSDRRDFISACSHWFISGVGDWTSHTMSLTLPPLFLLFHVSLAIGVFAVLILCLSYLSMHRQLGTLVLLDNFLFVSTVILFIAIWKEKERRWILLPLFNQTTSIC